MAEGLATLEAVHSFGLGGCTNNVAFVSNDKVAHHVGQHVSIGRVDTGADDGDGGFDSDGGAAGADGMSFLGIDHGVREVLAMDVSANMKRIALCERLRPVGQTQGTAQVSIFAVTAAAGTRRCKHLRTLTTNSQGEMIACRFTADAQFVVAIGPEDGRAA